MKAAERAARIDRLLLDLRGSISPTREQARWLSNVEHEVRCLLEDAESAEAIQAELAGVYAEMRRIDMDRQLIADAAAVLIDNRRTAV